MKRRNRRAGIPARPGTEMRARPVTAPRGRASSPRWRCRALRKLGITCELELETFAAGARSYREIKDRDPWRALKEWLSGPQKAGLESYAPERITLANGMGAKVTYEDGKPPRIGLKVQQLYGVDQTPTVAGQPVLVEVLAPNQRPWQTTQDLESFWERGYAQMKKDLAGRYPKHRWPEDPAGADPGRLKDR